MVLLKNIPIILLFLMLISFNQSCTTAGFGQHADSLFLVDDAVKFTYDLKRPDRKYNLPYVLEEISGLAFKPPRMILSVDDESGKIFEFDLEKKEIIHSIEFYKPDDYEGIELVENVIYVLKSDGDLFRLSYTLDKKNIAEKVENDLGSHNDTEGLGFDPSINALLIACKEDPNIDKKNIKGRAFYKVDRNILELHDEPMFSISRSDLKHFWERAKGKDYDKERIKFKPSAISTHPLSGNYYILSSVGKMLVVTDKKGGILATYPISPRILGQPEGLCFDDEGNMYISSEGEGDRGYILKFKLLAKRN